MSISSEYEHSVGLRVNALILDRRPLDEVLADIDSLEAEASEWLLSHDEPENLIELRRNLCGLRLSKAYDLKGPVKLARTLLSQFESLGFENSEEELTFIVIFARLCLAQGQPEEAKARLAKALAKESPGRFPVEQRLLDELQRAASS